MMAAACIAGSGARHPADARTAYDLVLSQIGAIALNLYTQAQAEGYGAEDAAAVFKLLRP